MSMLGQYAARSGGGIGASAADEACDRCESRAGI